MVVGSSPNTRDWYNRWWLLILVYITKLCQSLSIARLHLFECPVNWSKFSLLMSLSYTLPLQIANQQFVLQLHDMGNRALVTLDARAYLFCEPWLIRLGGWLPLGNNFFNIESLILCFLWRSFILLLYNTNHWYTSDWYTFLNIAGVYCKPNTWRYSPNWFFLKNHLEVGTICFPYFFPLIFFFNFSHLVFNHHFSCFNF